DLDVSIKERNLCADVGNPILSGMQPFSDRLADDNDGMRASDADRDHAIGELRDRVAEGRLSQETFLVRMDAALHAKDRSGRSQLFTDLPTETKRPGSGGLRERLSLLRLAVTGRPARKTRRLRVPRARIPYPQAIVPSAALPLPLPPQPDRRFTIGRAMAC